MPPTKSSKQNPVLQNPAYVLWAKRVRALGFTANEVEDIALSNRYQGNPIQHFADGRNSGFVIGTSTQQKIKKLRPSGKGQVLSGLLSNMPQEFLRVQPSKDGPV